MTDVVGMLVMRVYALYGKSRLVLLLYIVVVAAALAIGCVCCTHVCLVPCHSKIAFPVVDS